MEHRSLLAALSPPLCVACRQLCARERPLCDGCVFELNCEEPVWGDPPAGTGDCVAAFRHEGTARSLLHAFKFGRMPSLAPLLAGYMTENISRPGDGLTVVPVPAARIRRVMRGYDSAALLAGEVAVGLPGCRLDTGVIVRFGLGRQRGGDRKQRVASPPDIRPARHGPDRGRLSGPVLLVDDVITTGATVSACAAVLRHLGADRVVVLGFTRRV